MPPDPREPPPESCGESCCVMLGFLLGAVGGGLGLYFATTLPFPADPPMARFAKGVVAFALAPSGGVAGGAFASRLARRWWKKKP